MNSLLAQIVECLCSTRNLQTSFMNLQRLLKPHTGVEGVFLGHHAPDRKEVHDLVYADSNGSYDLDKCKVANKDLHHYLLSANRQELNVLPELGQFPAMTVALSMIPADHRLYDLRVRLDGAHIGMLAFHTSRSDLGDDTMRLFMQIRHLVALPLAARLDTMSLEVGSAEPAHGLFSPETPHRRADHSLYSASPLMHALQHKVAAVASSDVTVLLTGETGVGKDVYARHIHALSSRRNGPFVHVNCGAIAESLLDSELFGYERGAFTGARSTYAGLFEQADTGTLFLDEIGELPLPSQVRLLLVLQDRCIRRVGGSRTVPLNIRVIAATNRNLETLCRTERFRRDLLFRLNGITLHIPALRERPEDIPVLAEQLLRTAARECGLAQAPSIHPADMDILVQAPWPGNVRELGNCLRRSLIFSTGPVLRLDAGGQPLLEILPEAMPATVVQPVPPAFAQSLPESTTSLHGHIRQHLIDALARSKGRIHGPGGAADILGIHPSTLRSRLHKLGIPFGRTR